jgi:DNA-binding winged helix-turn-helix (wHTH) protein
VARNQRDVASAGQPEPENEPWGPPPAIDDHGDDAEAESVVIDYDSLEGEMFERFVADHGRRVRALESALARLIDLMTVRRDLGGTGDEHDGPVVWEKALHDIRRLVQSAAWELADALTDLEGRFYLEWEPEYEDPFPPDLIAFDWLRSITYLMFNRARYVDTYEFLPDGRGVYRQQPPAWPILEDLVARTVKCPDGRVVIRPSPHGDLSEREILVTKDELGALRSCLALLRIAAASEVSLPSVGRYRWKRVPPKLPSPAGQSTARRNDRDSTKECGFLGFRMDVNRPEVFRDGHEQGVILTPLQFAIFNLLVRVQGALVPLEVLDEAWEKTGRAKPDRSALHVAVSELRGSLKPFGVRIENSPSLGYKLIDPNSEYRAD